MSSASLFLIRMLKTRKVSGQPSEFWRVWSVAGLDELMVSGSAQQVLESLKCSGPRWTYGILDELMVSISRARKLVKSTYRGAFFGLCCIWIGRASVVIIFGIWSAENINIFGNLMLSFCDHHLWTFQFLQYLIPWLMCERIILSNFVGLWFVDCPVGSPSVFGFWRLPVLIIFVYISAEHFFQKSLGLKCQIISRILKICSIFDAVAGYVQILTILWSMYWTV